MRRRTVMLSALLAGAAVAGATGSAALAAPAPTLTIGVNAYQDGPANRFLVNVELGSKGGAPVTGATNPNLKGRFYVIACYGGVCRRDSTTPPRASGSVPTEVEIPFRVAGSAIGTRVTVRLAACNASLGCAARTFRGTVTPPVSPG
jgi:hypothetical protein